MAPHITFDGFDKKLESLPTYFNCNSPCELTYFFNKKDGYLYELRELSSLNGAEYSGCIEVRYCDFNEMALGGVAAVAKEILKEVNDPYLAAQQALNAGFDIESQKMVAIYLFKDFEINNDGNKEIGKQIKAARIDEDYEAAGISTQIYEFIAKKYKILVCDTTQTPQGHLLWAFGISKWGSLRIYNSNEQKFIGIFNKIDSNPEIKPWSVPFTLSMQDEESFRKDVCDITEETYHHKVLVVIASEVFI